MKNFKTDNTKKDFYKNALIGAGISLIITALIFVLMAVLMIVFDIGNAYASPLSSIALALGAFFGSMVAARKNGRRGMITGLVCGLILFGIILLVAAFLSDSFTIMTLLHFIITISASLIGGIVGVNKSEKRKII